MYFKPEHTGCRFIFAWLSVLIFVLTASVLQAQEAQTPKVYRSRQLGDKAFAEGSYYYAAAFYEQYLEDAADDKRALKDAYECLIPAYIRSNRKDEARKTLDKFLGIFPDSSEKVKLFQADILLMEKNYRQAKELYSGILKELKPGSDRFFHVLNALGFADERLKDWSGAVKVYSSMAKEGKGSDWEFKGNKRKIYSLIMSGALTEAGKALEAFPEFKESNRRRLELKLLKILLLVRENKLKQAETLFRGIDKKAVVAPFPMLYEVAFEAAETYLGKKSPETAIFFFQTAFSAAGETAQRQDALRALVKAYYAAGQVEKAVLTTDRFLLYYGDSPEAPLILVQKARLLDGLGKYDEAVKIYSEIMTGTELPEKMRFDAAKQAAKILIDRKYFAKAGEKLSYIVKNASSEADKGEGEYLLAELLYIQGKYKEAAAAFINTAAKYKPLNSKSMYMAMRSFIESKEPNKAFSISEQLKEELPPDNELFEKNTYYHALILEMKGELAGAADEFTSFLKLYPESTLAPKALFASGRMFYSMRKYKDAEKIFSDFLKKYPSDKFTAAALYRKAFSLFFEEKVEDAIKNIDILTKQYPESKYSIGALFWLSNYYKSEGQADKSIGVLKNMLNTYKSDSETRAEALYKISENLFALGKHKEALDYLNELSANYPGSEFVSDGMFLSGKIHQEKGDYSKAITFFIKAAERKPGSKLETVCWSKTGDCYQAMHNINFKAEDILNAIKYYKMILDKKDLPIYFKWPVLYKIGKCNELMGDSGTALEKYRRVVYDYQVSKDNGENVSAFWMVKSARAAIAIYTKKETPKAAGEAIKLYDIMIKYKKGPVDDFKKLRDKLKRDFNL